MYASTVMLLVAGIALMINPSGMFWWILTPTTDGASAALAATVYLLLNNQTSRMTRAGLGYRPWRSPTSRRPVFARRFWLVFAAMALAVLLSLLLRGTNRVVLGLWASEICIVFAMIPVTLRINPRESFYRAECWGFLSAAIAVQPLALAMAWVVPFAFGVAHHRWEMPGVIYCAAVPVGTALCAIGLGMGPVPLSSDGWPYERYPASIYSERIGKALIRWSAAMARSLMAAGAAATSLILLAVGYVSLKHGGLGAAMTTAQFGLALMLIGSMLAASFRRAVILSELLQRRSGLPPSDD
jgi:hypothetical protein